MTNLDYPGHLFYGQKGISKFQWRRYKGWPDFKIFSEHFDLIKFSTQEIFFGSIIALTVTVFKKYLILC